MYLSPNRLRISYEPQEENALKRDRHSRPSGAALSAGP